MAKVTDNVLMDGSSNKMKDFVAKLTVAIGFYCFLFSLSIGTCSSLFKVLSDVTFVNKDFIIYHFLSNHESFSINFKCKYSTFPHLPVHLLAGI